MDLPDEAREFIDRERVGRLATVGADGSPHVVPVCFALLDGRIYSVIDRKPKRTTRLQRLRNLEANPQAALIVDRYTEDWDRLAWVLLRGRADVITEGGEHARALETLRRKYPQYRTMDLAGRPVIRLTPERVNVWGFD